MNVHNHIIFLGREYPPAGPSDGGGGSDTDCTVWWSHFHL